MGAADGHIVQFGRSATAYVYVRSIPPNERTCRNHVACFAETPDGMDAVQKDIQVEQPCRHLQHFSTTKKCSTKISYWEDDPGSLTGVTFGSA